MWLRRNCTRWGILSRIDATALEMYSVAYGNWKHAQVKIQEFGPIVKSDKPSGMMMSPYMRIADKAFDQMKAMLAEFGMTPSSRSRLTADKGAASIENRFATIRER